MNNALDIPMPTYFAVERLGGETSADVVSLLCARAQARRTLFRRVETLSRMEFGKVTLIRMRTDLPSPEVVALLVALRSEGRGVVTKAPGGWVAQLTTGIGPVAGVKMLAVPVPGDQKLFKGPKIQGWRGQFPALGAVAEATP